MLEQVIEIVHRMIIKWATGSTQVHNYTSTQDTNTHTFTHKIYK